MLGPRRYPRRAAPRSVSGGARYEAAYLGSPQPVVVPEPCSSSLIPSSVPADATVTANSTHPDTSDELGPGPSPESRPVGPAAGHAGTWSPPPTRLHESPCGGEHSAPQPSAWPAQTGGTAFGEERTPLRELWSRGWFVVCLFAFVVPPPFVCIASPPRLIRPDALSLRISCVEMTGGGARRAPWNPGSRRIPRELQNPEAPAPSLSQVEGLGRACTGSGTA